MQATSKEGGSKLGQRITHTCVSVPLQVDVWALGISAIEMAEIVPPRWKIHPLRVIFMISRDPPPGLADPAGWSDTFKDFLAQCLQKVGGVMHIRGVRVCWCVWT